MMRIENVHVTRASLGWMSMILALAGCNGADPSAKAEGMLETASRFCREQDKGSPLVLVEFKPNSRKIEDSKEYAREYNRGAAEMRELHAQLGQEAFCEEMAKRMDENAGVQFGTTDKG